MLNSFTKTFHYIGDAIKQHPRYIDSEGGTRSSKTFSSLQWLIILAKHDKTPTLTSVVSETMPHLKRGAIRDFHTILADEWDDSRWSKVDCIYTFASGSRIEFFSADQPGKVHGPARDRLFINEAVNIDFETARQLFVRTTDLIICDYNPTHAYWMHERIAPREDCISIHSTFEDNDYLSEAQIREIKSNQSDENWWRVYGLGLVGRLEGIIYDFEQIDSLPEVGSRREAYGLDFGYTNDPSVLDHVLVDTGRKELYIDELFYQRGLLNDRMAALMAEQGVPQHSVPIYADCAEPKTIAELCSYGYNVKPCVKATRKAEQIQRLKGYKMFITKRSVNTIKEARGYVWQKDKDGNPLNEPIGINDHSMDALRYGAFTLLDQHKEFTFSIL